MSSTRRRRLIPILILLAIAAIGAVVWWKSGSSGQSAAPPATAVAAIGNIENSVSALGKIGPKTYVDVGAQLSGQLEKLHVDVGDRVEQDALLAEIDPRIFESQVEGNRARVDSLKAQLAERLATLELAQATHARNESAAERGLIAREVLDTSAAQLKQAQAQIVSLRAQLKEAQSTLDGNTATLGYSRIYAPMAGTVVSLTALEGQTLNANQTAPTILRIADLDTMTVTAQVAEADIGRISVDMPAWFTTLGQPDRRWQGTVRQIQPTPDIVNEVVLFKVLIDVDNSDGALLPDMTAQVFFTVSQARGVVTVPVAAVFSPPQSGGQSFVRIPGPEGSSPHPVQTGLRDRENVEIVSGLAAGDTVLLPAASTTQRPNASAGARPPMGMMGGPRR
ncbi:MAG: efflux RND transporter periplasmic adaptor subunit [Gammaproteobacteria bacterium]|nr:efflux RND transporter periplasmic adaptor subunit [Gammaproteobacteria bacterium]